MNDFVVLSDFDGTIADDLSTLIYTKFASVGMHYADLWSQGLITTPEEITMTFETINASKTQLAQAICEAYVDLYFPVFFHLCKEKSIKVAIVSDGLEWSIRTLLAHHGVENIDIYANQIHFLDEGYGFSFPWHHERCPHSGVCKPIIIEKYQAQGKKVIYIGDGKSDREAIHEADVIYAKDHLMDYCNNENVPAIGYQNFKNLVETLRSGEFPPSQS